MSEELKNEEKNNKKKNKAKGLKITLLVLGALLVVLITGSVIYINDYYHASDEALQALSDPPEAVSIMMGSASGSGDIIVYEPENATTGLIFNPGAKVAYEAYAPLMKACSEKGILCIIVKMPGNLAMLGINGADGLQEAYPYIEHWYIGGHSLGGAVAAMYAYDHSDEYEGVILLAAYSTKDLGASNLNVLSIYGSEDEVLNKANYDKYKDNLGDDYEEIVIEGGCHAYFGSYGNQKGDGNPTISREEQIKETVNAISDFVDPVDYTAEVLNSKTPEGKWEYYRDFEIGRIGCVDYKYSGQDDQGYYRKMNVYIFESREEAKAAYEYISDYWFYEIKEKKNTSITGLESVCDADILAYVCIKKNMIITTNLDTYSTWADEAYEGQYDREYDSTIIDIIDEL